MSYQCGDQDAPARLAALAAYDILDTPAEREFDDVVLIAAHACATPIALVSLADRDRQWFKARVGFEAAETPIKHSVCVYALDSHDLLVIPDLTLDARTCTNALVTREAGIRFYAGAPLIAEGDVVIGTLCVIDRLPRPGGLTEVQAQVLEALARQVVTQLEMRRRIQVREALALENLRAISASSARAAAGERENASLRERETRYRVAQEAGRIGTFELDVRTDLLTVSAEFCRLYGLAVAPHVPVTAIEALALPDFSGDMSNARSRADGSAALDVEYRIRRADDGALRWVERRGNFRHDAAGRPTSLFGTVQDVTDRHALQDHSAALLELGDALRHAETRAAMAAAAAAILGSTLEARAAGYGTMARDGATLSVEGDWTIADEASAAGDQPIGAHGTYLAALQRGETVAVADVATDRRTAAAAATLQARGIGAFMNLPLLDHGRFVALLFVHAEAPRVWTPAEIAFARGVADRAYAAQAKMHAEAEQDLLNQEISHRLKNTLAMVQAIARQTLRAVPERAPVDAFEQRIFALSTAHDVLLQQSWAPAPIGVVIARVLTAFGRAANFDSRGPDVLLGSRATLSLSMILHEMTTNAVKYGCLATEAGRVALSWDVDGAGADATFHIDWREHGGPPARAPAEKGFGSRLIQMGLMGAGGVDITYPPGGLEARMTAPLADLQRS